MRKLSFLLILAIMTLFPGHVQAQPAEDPPSDAIPIGDTPADSALPERNLPNDSAPEPVADTAVPVTGAPVSTGPDAGVSDDPARELPAEPAATPSAAPNPADTEHAALAGDESLTELIVKAQNGEPVIPELVRALVDLAKHQTQFPKEVDDINLEQPGFRKALGEAILAAATTQFSTKSSADLLGLKKLAQKFLEPTDPNQRSITRLFALVERCEHLSATQNILDLVELRKSSSSPAESAILERFVMKAISDKVESLLQLGSPGKGLRVLAESEPGLRDEKTVKMARSCLDGIREQIDQNRFDSNDWPFEVTKVKELVDWVCNRDKSTLPLLGQIYSWPLLMAIKNNDPVVAEKMFKQVLTLRPDPNPSNDTLRLTIALSAKGRDAQNFAAERIAELAEEGKLTWSDKLKLLGSGYYGFMSSIFLTLAVVAVLCAMFFILLRPLMRQRKTEIEAPRAKPRNMRGYQVPYEEEDEYSKLLSIFGLTDEATEDDIKKAFRTKVKELHPDSQGLAADSSQNQEFIALRRSYDRIIEIRKSWFGA